MKTKVVSIEELKEDNSTLCLSPLRVFGECHKCPTFKHNLDYNKNKYRNINKAIEETLKNIKCNPKINLGTFELIKKKEKLLKEIKEINKKLGD